MTATATRLPGKPGRPRTRKERPAGGLPAPAHQRTQGPQYSGSAEDKAHFIPVGHRLRLLRMETGLNQKDFALATLQDDPQEKGLTPYTVNRFENGVHSPRPKNAILLAKTLSRLLGRQIEVSDLTVRDADGLVDYLEAVRGNREAPAEFYGRLRIPEERARKLRAGTVAWTGDELGRVAMHYPGAADLVRDVLIAQAKRKDGYPAAFGEVTTKWDGVALPTKPGARPEPNPDPAPLYR
jgi:transcriptional regulator with XRE-family HTH domain